LTDRMMFCQVLGSGVPFRLRPHPPEAGGSPVAAAQFLPLAAGQVTVLIVGPEYLPGVMYPQLHRTDKFTVILNPGKE
jgi:hypothetical protein